MSKFNSQYMSIIAVMFFSIFLNTSTLASSEEVKTGGSESTSKSYMLKSGTPVDVRVVEDVSPKKNKAGDRIMMVVNHPVSVDGVEVIRMGAPVWAEITKSKKAGIAGQAGELMFSFKTVEAVDGQNVMLSGSQNREGDDKTVESVALGVVCCPLFLLMSGDKAVVKSGTTILVYIIRDTTVKVSQ